jgi:murein DD-endopeptidase MepM/ murein hydrolase activator NlpD
MAYSVYWLRLIKGLEDLEEYNISMKKPLLIVMTLLFLILVSLYIFPHRNTPQESVGNTPPTATNPIEQPAPAVAPVSNYYYPMTSFDSRIKYRWFGKYVDGRDKVPDCGATFVGYHNAVDLEVTPAEKSIDVPVYAISDGTVRMVQYVSGYGGLLVLGATINGSEVTINYGHVRLSSIPFRVGDTVKAGQKLAVLGSGCSSETSGERKHLHLAIHRGSAVDVRGYLPNQAALSVWIDPKTYLASLKANSPK